MEYLVLDRKTQGNDLTQVEFGLHGDPGSLVINRFYEVCGPQRGKTTSCVGPGGEGIPKKTRLSLAMTTPEISKNKLVGKE